jgi:hypothetical protein
MLMATLLLGSSGCSTVPKSDEGYAASVVIAKQTAQAIEDETAFVFAEAGYEVVRLGRTMLFERRGSLGSRLAYGGLLDDQGVRIRVRASTSEISDSVHRLQCRAVIVTYPGESAFEEEIKLGRMRMHPYQRLLDRVARNLKEQRPAGKPTGPAATSE